MISSFSKVSFNKTTIHNVTQKYASKSTKEWLKIKPIQMLWDNLKKDCAISRQNIDTPRQICVEGWSKISQKC